MKHKLFAAIIALVLLFSIVLIPAQAAPPIEIAESIQKGINWLVSQQNGDGSWGGYEQVAHTGLALTKLEDRAYELGYESPFDPLYPYHSNVEAGLNYLFNQASNHAAGGICFAAGAHETYNTGVAMMAIASSRTPNRPVPSGPFAGQTYKQVLQGNVAFFAATQNTDGGWKYSAGFPYSDQSNTGYAVLGLRYAEAHLYGFNCAIPASIKAGQNNWISYIQNTDGIGWHPDPTGGSGYNDPHTWVNILKTGNLLFETSFVGDPVGAARVQSAINYIERHWNDLNPDQGWKGHYQAMYCLMKGLESLNVQSITVGGNPVNWFDEVSTEIVNTQHPDGYWPNDGMWGNPILNTCWALLALERSVPPTEVEGRMTGGGSILMPDRTRVRHGFELHGDVTKLPNNLEVTWGKGNRFHLEKLTSAHLFDSPVIDPNPPKAGFDVYRGAGTGRYNGVYGARAIWVFTDAGQPGKNDRARIDIFDAGGNLVLSVAGNLSSGNHQAHAK